ncbi:amino acid dehydrogenase [Cupriavidus sp. USMAA2-4]|uniref:Amino acid dehydrogenase n=1 Tax=Cupriavidus malaysiensis TaxID=367825 RepID=A0ABM6FD40_9BURK|nr:MULTISPECIES: D-amino acid dehydrogenase [Cupriavidus]AOY96660.1 amino acid dehydrogenase [Cupriavidus sp. USMAA2-4]AOZ02934.1 amino acid dehydrogenase [Cupriavidus sp. USMAHM13]AOZ09694.1 amino acid dehydrogenase [Cupriavidus malaysiensis]
MKVIVMGAGVIGVASAWYLAKAGHEVVVLERNAGAARETSFGNGGQISVSHAEPWANPAAPWKLLRWLGKEDAPLLFRLRADPAQWSWGLKFLRECSARRSTHNMIQLLNLGTYSRASLQALRAETGIEYDHLSRGILHFYTSAKEFDAAIEPARIMRELGCERQVIGADEVVRIEPALAAIAPRLAGATYTSADESGDVHRFTTALAARCEAAGVRFRYGVRVQRLHADGGGMRAVEYADDSGAYQLESADAYVLALGSFSPLLARPLGIKLDIYPAKGYSATLPVLDAERAPSVSLTDDEYKLVFSRFGDRLRIAGTAELNGYAMELNPLRCEAIVRRTLEIFPGMSRPELARYWTGLRPATPGNVPYIGASSVAGLYLNTGHGTLGWTHGCGSGRAIADIISGRAPEVDFAFSGALPQRRVAAVAATGASAR